MAKLLLVALGASLLLATPSTGVAAVNAQTPPDPTSRPPIEPASEPRSAVPVVSIENEPPARLIAYPPVPSQLADGRVVIAYRTENLIIRPVFGAAALGVSPRIGHLHVRVDNSEWRWLDTSNEPVVVNGLAPGPHSVLIELVTPTHKTIDKQLISFVVPDRRANGESAPGH